MERRHLTLMFTDIVGYSRLMGQNENQTIGLVGEYRRILLTRIEEFEGHVIEFIGDAVFARFDAPLSAVNAGIAIQNDLQAFNENSESYMPALRTRIGIHSGEVTQKDEALFGDDVNIAARLEPLAVADGLCISECVYTAVKSEINQPIKKLGAQSLKNIDGKIRAYLIRPNGITKRTHLHYALRTFQQKITAFRYPLAVALICLIASGFYLVPRWLVPGYSANYVEIADFKNLMSDGAKSDYFSAGITEALRSQLADMEDVYILDPTKGVRGPIRLEGSIQKVGDSLRIAYRLFRRKDNVQIAGGKLDGAYKDIFILQDRIVAEIGQYLAKEFQLKFFRPAALNLTSDVTAYDYYLKGMEFLRLPETHANFDAAIKYMTTSLVHDGEFAGANAGICRAYRGKYKLTQKVELLGKAEEYCLVALEQDDGRSDVYISLGLIQEAKGSYKNAESYLKKAVNLDSESVEAAAFLAGAYHTQNRVIDAERAYLRVLDRHYMHWRGYFEYSYFLIAEGRMVESISVLEKALEFTPENEPALSNLGGTYLYLGEYRKAAKMFESAADIVPSAITYSNAGTGYYYSGDYNRAVESYESAIKLAPEDYRLMVNLAESYRKVSGRTEDVKKWCKRAISLATKSLKVNSHSSEPHQFLALAYLHVGDVVRSEQHLVIALRLNPSDIDLLFISLRVWSLLKRYELALDVLTRLVEDGYPVNLIESDPDLRELRDLPRYSLVIGKDVA